MTFRVRNDIIADGFDAIQSLNVPLETLDLNVPGSVVFDPTTNEFHGRANNGVVPLSSHVISTIQTGVTPAGIAVTSDGSKAYVANNNNYGLTYESGANCDSVTVINLTTNLPIKTITDSSFSQPYTVTISPDGTTAYVTNSFGTTITIIDISTDTVTGTITGFNGPSGMAINPSGTTAYVNNYGADGSSGTGNTVSIVNLLTNTISSTVTVGLAPAALAISPDGSFVYVINYQTGVNDGTMSVIRTSNNAVTITALSGLSGPFGIALSTDGLTAYVTNFGSNNFSPFGTTLSVINLTTFIISSTLTLGIQPSGVAVAGNYLYVSNYNTLYAGPSFTNLTAGAGTVNIINLETLTIVPVTIVVGQSPSIITVVPSRGIALVSNFGSNTISVIALN